MLAKAQGSIKTKQKRKQIEAQVLPDLFDFCGPHANRPFLPHDQSCTYPTLIPYFHFFFIFLFSKGLWSSYLFVGYSTKHFRCMISFSGYDDHVTCMIQLQRGRQLTLASVLSKWCHLCLVCLLLEPELVIVVSYSPLHSAAHGTGEFSSSVHQSWKAVLDGTENTGLGVRRYWF
jgi:hypothetical protein